MDHRKSRGERRRFLTRVATYAAFAILFWVPFYYLVKNEGFSENNALIAAGIGVIPILVLFSPAFERLAERISSVKVAGVEIGLEEAIHESIYGPEIEQIAVRIDAGRDEVYGKSSMREFTDSVNRFLPNPSKRLVLSVNVGQEERVLIPMLYFQSRILQMLFDLRAILFLDEAKPKIEDRVLGTMSPQTALRRMERAFPGLDSAFSAAVDEEYELLVGGRIADAIGGWWAAYRDDLGGNLTVPMTREAYRNVFAGGVEQNLVSYPTTDYAQIYSLMDIRNTHLILTKNSKVINVRTIDRVAREITQGIITAVLRKANSEGKGEIKEG